MIWIDEAQDLFCADRNLILRALKSLMQGEHAITIIVSGTLATPDLRGKPSGRTFRSDLVGWARH